MREIVSTYIELFTNATHGFEINLKHLPRCLAGSDIDGNFTSFQAHPVEIKYDRVRKKEIRQLYQNGRWIIRRVD